MSKVAYIYKVDYLKIFLSCICIYLATEKFLVQSFAKNLNSAEAAIQLQSLNKEILLLKQKIATTHNKYDFLTKNLNSIEKKINSTVLELNNKKQEITLIEDNIKSNAKEHKLLKQKLTEQQLLLIKYIRARYKVGEYQPLVWLINIENKHVLNRLLIFYQYLINERQKLIHNIRENRMHLILNKRELQKDLAKLSLLKESLAIEEQKLNTEKNYQQKLKLLLNAEITNKQTTLKEYESNKQNLTLLLKKLTSHPFLHQPSTIKFIDMHHKLSTPIMHAKNSMQKINQGIAFFVKEDTPVFAAKAGKVVFSDWLKGYGFLLIIDHGNKFMTLYAYNKTLLKSTGAYVSQHEQIATVGHTGIFNQNGLYFEVRYNGKAISPLEWLA